MLKVTVLGAGCWGTALAHHLAKSGYETTLWSFLPEELEKISKDGENKQYLPGLKLHSSLKTDSNIETAAKQAELVVFATPSFAIRETAKKFSKHIKGDAIVLSVAKGLDPKTFKTLSTVLEEELNNPVAILSGPSFALEVVKGVPTAVTVAANDLEVAKKAAIYFHHDNFRVYASDDLIGVEYGGVVKNVIAVAAGIADGMETGHNGRAALITRGMVEMARFIVAMGGDQKTVYGLSGLGDLLLTATGDLSRNRRVGLRLGNGEKLDDIIESLGQVAEGVKSAELVLELAKKNKVEMPIVQEVNRVLKGEHTPEQAIKVLLSRDLKVE